MEEEKVEKKKVKRLVRKRKKKSKVSPIEKEIRLLIETGKVLIGSRQGIRELLIGNPKAVIYASNIPKELILDIEYYADEGDIIKLRFPGTSLELGKLCGKPFPVSLITVYDEGESDLSKLKKLTSK